jgi:hypothetical protein
VRAKAAKRPVPLARAGRCLALPPARGPPATRTSSASSVWLTVQRLCCGADSSPRSGSVPVILWAGARVEQRRPAGGGGSQQAPAPAAEAHAGRARLSLGNKQRASHVSDVIATISERDPPGAAIGEMRCEVQVLGDALSLRDRDYVKPAPVSHLKA